MNFLSKITDDDDAETVFNGATFFSTKFETNYNYNTIFAGNDFKIVTLANFVKTILHEFVHYKRIKASS